MPAWRVSAMWHWTSLKCKPTPPSKSHEWMVKAEAQLEKEIKGLIRKAELLDAQEDGKY